MWPWHDTTHINSSLNEHIFPIYKNQLPETLFSHWFRLFIDEKDQKGDRLVITENYHFLSINVSHMGCKKSLGRLRNLIKILLNPLSWHLRVYVAGFFVWITCVLIHIKWKLKKRFEIFSKFFFIAQCVECLWLHILTNYWLSNFFYGTSFSGIDTQFSHFWWPKNVSNFFYVHTVNSWIKIAFYFMCGHARSHFMHKHIRLSSLQQQNKTVCQKNKRIFLC